MLSSFTSRPLGWRAGETLAPFGSRVLTALQLTIWCGSVDVILERRAWRMSVQENNILPGD
jgi:hypothetical protein